MPNEPCSKCGATDIPKYVRKRKVNKTGKRGSRNQGKTVASYCILCHREEQRIIDARRYEKKLEYNRIWKRENREKANAYERKWYAKRRKHRAATAIDAIY